MRNSQRTCYLWENTQEFDLVRTRPTPIMADERTAAELLCMKPSEFIAAVKAGHLPSARTIMPGVDRWPVDELRRIGSGDAIEGGAIPW